MMIKVRKMSEVKQGKIFWRYSNILPNLFAFLFRANVGASVHCTTEMAQAQHYPYVFLHDLLFLSEQLRKPSENGVAFLEVAYNTFQLNNTKPTLE